MAWITLHQRDLARQEHPVLFNTDLIYKVESSGQGTRIHSIAPGSSGHTSETVTESFAEVTVMLTVEDSDD